MKVLSAPASSAYQGWHLLLETVDQREEHDAIGYHGEGIALGNALFAENEEGEAVACADHTRVVQCL